MSLKYEPSSESGHDCLSVFRIARQRQMMFFCCGIFSSSLLSLQVLECPWALSCVIQEFMSLKYELASAFYTHFFEEVLFLFFSAWFLSSTKDECFNRPLTTF